MREIQGHTTGENEPREGEAMPRTLLPLPEITATVRMALTLFAAQALRHADTVCPVGNCRRHRCCTIDDARTGEFLCVLLLYEDERRAFDAALALAEHLCLHFVAGDLAGWYRRRLSEGAASASVNAAGVAVPFRYGIRKRDSWRRDL
jgi:hypothetical protein